MPVGPDVLAGLKLSLTHRTAPRIEDEIAGRRAPRLRRRGSPAAARSSSRSIWSAGGRCRRALRAALRALHRRVLPLPRRFRRPGHRSGARRTAWSQIGFDDDDALLPNDNRIFRGFDLSARVLHVSAQVSRIQPRRSSRAVMPRLTAKSVELLFVFDEVNSRLPAAVHSGACSRSTPRRPSICSRRRPTGSRSDRTSTNITSFPTAAAISTSSRTGFWTSMRTIRAGKTRSRCIRCIRRRARRRRVASRTLPTRCAGCRGGGPWRRRNTAHSSDYTGTDMFISLVEPAGIEDERGDRRAQRPRAVLEPAPHRASSGRRGRRRFPPARRRDARCRLHRRSDAAARAGGRRSCAAAARPRTPGP